MPSIEDVYTFYLKAADLQGQPRTVTIETVTIEKIFNPRTKRNEPYIVLRFKNKKRVLPINKTQATALATITGTDDYTQWPKATIILTPADHNGKETIKITAAPQPAPIITPPKRELAEMINELYP